MPPRMLAKLSGIITCEGEILSRRAQSWMTGAQSRIPGRRIATSGVLFMNELITTVGRIIRACAREAVRGAPSARFVSMVMAPVSRRPAATTNSTATVNRPSFANPAKASWGV